MQVRCFAAWRVLGLDVVTVGDADDANVVKAEDLKPGSILSADSADPAVIDGRELALKRTRGGIVTIAPDNVPRDGGGGRLGRGA